MPMQARTLVVRLTILAALIGGVWLHGVMAIREEVSRFEHRSERLTLLLDAVTHRALETADALRTAAVTNLVDPGQHAFERLALLGPVAGRDGYGLVGVAPPVRPEAGLNLTGQGAFDRTDATLRRELAMALSLEPAFRWVRRAYPETPWVYYISARGFMSLYPYLPFEHLFMSEAIHGLALYTKGAPGRNPGRRPYVSEVYLDAAGRGPMVAFGAPVYVEGQFHGIVGFDLTLDAIGDYLAPEHGSGDRVYVVDDDGTVIAAAGPDVAGYPDSLAEARPALFAQVSAHPDSTLGVAGAQVRGARLAGVPWLVICERSNWRIYRHALLATLPLVLFLGVLLGAITLFVRERQRQRNRESERSLRRFRHLLDCSTDMIAVVDPHTARYLDANQTFRAFLGLSADEMLARRPLDLGAAFGSMERWGRLVERVRRDGRLTFELEGELPDGRGFAVEVNAHHASTGGEEYIVTVIRDVSERKHAETERARLQRALQQAQKLEAIGQLTSGIAHDFNNTLASIQWVAELARRQFGVAEPRLDAQLEQIMAAVNGARALVRQLLVCSRGERTEAARPLLLVPRLREVLSMLRSVLPATLEIVTEWPARSPTVTVDPIHLQQLLMNLCINARDAMQGMGQISVGVRVRRLGWAECAICHEQVRGLWACIHVADSGPGIAPGIRDQIFEPFFTTKRLGEGAGMGLAVVSGIVRTYGGHLLLGTSATGGTRFDILLPLSAEVEPQGEPEVPHGAVEPVAIEGLRVLLVEDEPVILYHLKETLAGAGAQVEACADAAAALNCLARCAGGFELLITDQMMPGMSGLELVRQIRRNDTGIAVLMLTGDCCSIKQADLVRLRIAEVLLKPVTWDELAAAITRAMSR
ncbi:ATP-binding protein [Marichromatium bheemlicum]|uniref:histidine kinase n=1 Tax=Marichromatium bheemlicum TaxID=365339 RepID=A0ABX1IBL7_9GAMM|nr:ATP-binding protein [Marichromatium bheemlicum]NKN33597.1 response regulator [Marichromatium bheemlicum]